MVFSLSSSNLTYPWSLLEILFPMLGLEKKVVFGKIPNPANLNMTFDSSQVCGSSKWLLTANRIHKCILNTLYKPARDPLYLLLWILIFLMKAHCAKTKALFAAKKRQNPTVTVQECQIQPPFSLSVCDTSYTYQVVHAAQEKKKTATRTPADTNISRN